MFFPRGGSAHVARALARELPEHGWDVTIVSGSGAGHGDARTFYAGLDVHPVDFDAGDAPLHPSFEDRPGAADAVFAALDDEAFERHTAAWAHALEEAGAADHDVLHLHHLTPLHEAAARVAPGVPVVAHLHGTELLMLEAIEDGADWPYAAAWAERMRGWAARCERLLLLSPGQLERAERMLGIDPQRCVVSPNGFDPARFDHVDVDRDAVWRHALVDEPRGWRPGAEEGSIAYAEADLDALRCGPVIACVGRFTAVKRLPLLVRAWNRAAAAARRPASLVLIGGYPGEWETEHPIQTVAATGAQRVFLTGWHAHEELPELLSSADAIVLASVREQFGSVLVEGMACGLPAIAVDRLGPSEIVEDGVTGWLVPPDDEEALARALVACIDDDVERRRRGRRAWRAARERFSWPAIAEGVAGVFDEVAGGAGVESRLAAHDS
jgi:glycosyltransferase involved in cell wall biosynthesis